MEQLLLREPVQVRMGTDEEPGWCPSVGGKRGGCGCSRCAGPIEEAPADHADHRPVAAFRSGLRKDFAALPGESQSVFGRIRPGVVQADASRHGTAHTLPWTGGPERRTHL